MSRYNLLCCGIQCRVHSFWQGVRFSFVLTTYEMKKTVLVYVEIVTFYKSKAVVTAPESELTKSSMSLLKDVVLKRMTHILWLTMSIPHHVPFIRQGTSTFIMRHWRSNPKRTNKTAISRPVLPITFAVSSDLLPEVSSQEGAMFSK